MTAGFRISLFGDEELMRKLDRLPDKVFSKVVAGANRKVMQPVLRLAKSMVPVDSGTLRKSLILKTKKNPRKGLIFTLVGPRTKWGTIDQRGKKRFPQFYAHLVEGGHRVAKRGQVLQREGEGGVKFLLRAWRGGKKRGKAQGFVQGRPFIRPAFDAMRASILSRYRAELARGIVREAMKPA